MAREALSQETALTGSLAVHSHRLKHAHFQGAPPNRPHPQTGLPTEHEHAIQNHNTPNTPENDWRETKNQAFPDLKDFLRERAKDSVLGTWSGVPDPPSRSRKRGPGAPRRGCSSKLGSRKGGSLEVGMEHGAGAGGPVGRAGLAAVTHGHRAVAGDGGGREAVSGVRAGQDPLPPPHVQSPGPTFW